MPLLHIMVAAALADYQIRLETDVSLPSAPSGVILINVTSTWAPIGAAHLADLVADQFYDGAAFFRVVPDFVVQFGIAGTPSENQKWKDAIKDDPVIASNTEGTLTYAATAQPNSRTTQLFINTANNSALDAQGFAPLGRVVEGLDIVKAVFNPTPNSSSGVSQYEYETLGDEWIRKAYPGINFITRATVVE